MDTKKKKKIRLDKNYFNRDYFFDRKKSGYSDYRLRSHRWKWGIPIKYFKQFCSNEKDYLDVGCAFGYLVNFARPYFRSVAGVDISSYAISEARKYYPGITFLEADITKRIPFSQESFDFVSAVGTLEHVEDIDSALKEIYRILKIEGYGYFSVPYEGLARRIIWSRVDRDMSHIPIFTIKDYRKKLKKAGFRLMEQKRDWWIGHIHFLVQKSSKEVI